MITITEFLLKKQGDGRSLYKYHPTTEEELQDIILDLCNQGIYDLNCIDTYEITDMSLLFDIDTGIGKKVDMAKIDISRWNVSIVKSMFAMFYGCKSFNCDLSKWDVSNVIDMESMFENCESFNCDLNDWDISKVEYMTSMFEGCKAFNCNLSKWNISNVKNIFAMFDNCPTIKPTWYKKW